MSDDKPKYPRSSEREYRFVKPIIKLFSWFNTWVYEATGGRLLGSIPGGYPVGLLTVTGRKTGKPRTVPLCYGQEGERIVVIASQGGMPHHPLWYRNVVASPDVEFAIGTERRRYAAHFPQNDERLHFWQVACEAYPDFAEYQKRTTREIPVVVLEPR